MDFPFELPFLLSSPHCLCKNAQVPHGFPTELYFSEHPEVLKDCLIGLTRPGANAVCAPTAGANRPRLAANGLEDSVLDLNTRLVLAARSAAGGVPVGGAVGSSGLFVPPCGETEFDDIYSVYREQVRCLWEAGVDFLYLERQNSLADMRAAVLAARSTNLPVFACLEVDASGHSVTGGSFLPALLTLQAMGADAVGLAGTDLQNMTEILRDALPCASVPLFAVPDAENEIAPELYAQSVTPLCKIGVRMIAAGESAGPEHLRALAELLKGFGAPEIPEEPDNYAAATENEAFFLGDNIEFSEPILCTSTLEDDLIDLDDEQISAALVEVNCMDDAVLLGNSSHMTKLPVAVHAAGATVLEAALRYFQGRLMIDSRSPVERGTLEHLAAKYGAIIC